MIANVTYPPKHALCQSRMRTLQGRSDFHTMFPLRNLQRADPLPFCGEVQPVWRHQLRKKGLQQ